MREEASSGTRTPENFPCSAALACKARTFVHQKGGIQGLSCRKVVMRRYIIACFGRVLSCVTSQSVDMSSSSAGPGIPFTCAKTCSNGLRAGM